MDTEILVSVDLHGAPVFVGRLWWRSRRGRESASFEYDPGWLDHPERFALEPALALTPGPFHTAPGRSSPMPFSDTARRSRRTCASCGGASSSTC